MTEIEWLECTDPKPMLKFLLRPGQEPPTDRKSRLFACACCRHIWSLLPEQSNRELVTAVENHPDGSFDDAILNDAIVASSRHEEEFVDDDAYWAVKYLGRSFYKLRPLESAIWVANRIVSRASESEVASEKAAQAAIIRDLFGNPFRPTPQIERTWLATNDGAIRRLIQDIYNDRSFERLPVVADALQQAGCTDPDLLSHCRDGGYHARGCWLIDLLLRDQPDA